MPKQFNGEIKLDVRDSTPDWPAFLSDKAPEGAPNVLVVLYDDTGLRGVVAVRRPDQDAHDAIAWRRTGLIYSQWHTTALCSPTRSTFLTGRNHHSNGFASISEISTGFPGYNSHIPPENATMANILRDAGWSHVLGGQEPQRPHRRVDDGRLEEELAARTGLRPLLRVHRRRDQQLVSRAWPRTTTTSTSRIQPEDGYHLSKDLADKALEFIRDSKQSEPDKPWYLWFCPGANHAPHHAPQEYIDKYKGKFDDGYEAYREWVLPRMIEKGILPEGTELTPMNPMTDGTFTAGDRVRPWDTLSDEEKRMFCRMAEVYAGFSEYTDARSAGSSSYLEESGQLENTHHVLLCRQRRIG